VWCSPWLCGRFLFVYCCVLDKLIPQTDRPTSQFWNSGSIHNSRRLVQEFGIKITHMTEQSCHNKVCNILICKREAQNYIVDTKSKVDSAMEHAV
jgi:hypothetical protein